MLPENTVEQDFCCGKTYQERSVQNKAEILQSWLAKWLGPSSLSQKTAGKKPESHWEITALSNGAYLTLNTSDWRSGASVCSLSSTLETGPVDPRFFLSPKACAGILRRAEKRGKELPTMLRQALEQVAGDSIELAKHVDKTR